MTTMMKELDLNLVFNKVEWWGFPVGTPFEVVEPSGIHLMARAAVKGTAAASRYVKLAGVDEEASHVSTDEYLEVFSDVHPNCPSLTGPFIGQYGNVGIDRLPADTLAQVSVSVSYPFATYFLCMNDLYVKMGSDGQPVIIGAEELPNTLKVKIPKSVRETSAKTVRCELDKRINLTFENFDIVEDPNW